MDDPTWLHHLHRSDYSTWFRKVIKDDELAQEVASVEADAALDARQSRARVADVVTRRYTAPAGGRGQS
ncbi:MAG: hypothetical protein JO273_21900 [Methylobacteriaceae bacterium]|nr:hypothetical protein [Methylobacteriaceae bacterium]